jgi:hypothetical protein
MMITQRALATNTPPKQSTLPVCSTILVLLAAILVAVVSVPSAHAALSTGSFSLSGKLQSCPAANGTMPLSQAVCYTATITNCQANGSGGTIPSLTATVAVSTPPSFTGTVFLHNGGDGTSYFDAKNNGQGNSYATEYYNAGLQVIQIAWSSNWADNLNKPAVDATKYNACRPATLMTNVLQHFGGSGAKCAQGHSAGSAAIAYSLAEYNAGSYLNDVVLTSGPVYANIEAGCQYPPTQQFSNPVTICPSSQFGCIAGSSWTDPVQYSATQGTASFVANETNHPPANCNNYTGSNAATTTTQNQNWGGMSIVSSGASYSYPTTSLHAFLCTNKSSDGTQNNSAAEGELFYQKFTSGSQTLSYGVYGVDKCTSYERIWNGVLSSDGVTSAFTTSANDIINGCVK